MVTLLAPTAPVAAVLLVYPLASCLPEAVRSGGGRWDTFDALCDCLVACPVLVVQGTADGVLLVPHGRALAAAEAVEEKPLCVPGGGHDNVEVDSRQVLYGRYRAFVERVGADRNGWGGGGGGTKGGGDHGLGEGDSCTSPSGKIAAEFDPPPLLPTPPQPATPTSPTGAPWGVAPGLQCSPSTTSPGPCAALGLPAS